MIVSELRVSQKCKATKKDGTACDGVATESGYCTFHDPEKRKLVEQKRIAQREAARLHAQDGEKLYRAIDGIEGTCNIRGWTMVVLHVDDTLWKHVSLVVKIPRLTSLGRYYDEIGIDLTFSNSNVHVEFAPTRLTKLSKSLEDWVVEVHERLSECGYEVIFVPPPSTKKDQKTSADLGRTVETHPLETLKNVLLRFDKFVRQLGERFEGRPTLVVNDEYDVQYLLYAILQLFCDDIRAEDPSPIRAGAASRVDFILKGERIALEVKLATKGLKDRKIGEQISVDKERYRSRSDCKLVVFFIYDPAHQLKNPTGLENDLSETRPEIEFVVLVNPK